MQVIIIIIIIILVLSSHYSISVDETEKQIIWKVFSVSGSWNVAKSGTSGCSDDICLTFLPKNIFTDNSVLKTLVQREVIRTVKMFYSFVIKAS